jgi:hypothetical protein
MALCSHCPPCHCHLSLTRLCQWKIRLHFSMLIAIAPKQCNQGLVCTYNFILDISLTAIYCLKGKGREGEGGKRGGLRHVPLPQNKPAALRLKAESLQSPKKTAIIMGLHMSCLKQSRQRVNRSTFRCINSQTAHLGWASCGPGLSHYNLGKGGRHQNTDWINIIIHSRMLQN